MGRLVRGWRRNVRQPQPEEFLMKVIVITGGSRGIGASTAIECARRGFGVILTYNSQPDAAGSVVSRIESAGGHAVAMRLDVGDIASFDAFRSRVEHQLSDAWGGSHLDGLVNNAGYGLFKSMDSVDESAFDGLFNVHLKGAVLSDPAPASIDGEGRIDRQRDKCDDTRRVRRRGAVCVVQGRPRRPDPLHGEGIR